MVEVRLLKKIGNLKKGSLVEVHYVTPNTLTNGYYYHLDGGLRIRSEDAEIITHKKKKDKK